MTGHYYSRLTTRPCAGAGYQNRTDIYWLEASSNCHYTNPAIWGEQWGSNPQPPTPQAGALPLSYTHHVVGGGDKIRTYNLLRARQMLSH